MVCDAKNRKLASAESAGKRRAGRAELQRMCQFPLGFDSRAERQRAAIARDPFSLFLWQAGKTAPARRNPGRLRVGVAQTARERALVPGDAGSIPAAHASRR